MVIEEDMPRIEDECNDAYSNPKCPYVSVIKQQGKDIDVILKALIGDDMQGGLIAKINKLETANKILIFLGSTSFIAILGIAIKTLLRI